MPGVWGVDTVSRMNTHGATRRPLRVRHWFSPLVLALLATATLSVISMTGAGAAGLDGRPTATIQPVVPQEGSDSQPIAVPQPVPTEPQQLVVPPPGGLTLGFAGTTSPQAVLEAQGFEVVSMTVIDRESQQYFVFIPGGPDFVQTLSESTLAPDDVVILRRTGDPTDVPLVASQARTEEAGGVPFALSSPPEGGLTMGMAGTSDLAALIAAQPFEVSTVSLFDVPGQQWLVHVVGAPEHVNTLSSATLAPQAFVAMRRVGPPPPPPEPEPAAVEATLAEEAPAEPKGNLRSLGVGRITYYYCEKGSNSAAWGDGGGWCGHFASGKRVYEGGAACAREYRGQRFKIAGDPTGRVYVCEDTGGGVRGNHRDIFFWNSDTASNWIRQVGYEAEIFVVE